MDVLISKFYPSTATNISNTAVLLTDHYNVDLSIEVNTGKKNLMKR